MPTLSFIIKSSFHLLKPGNQTNQRYPSLSFPFERVCGDSSVDPSIPKCHTPLLNLPQFHENVYKNERRQKELRL